MASRSRSAPTRTKIVIKRTDVPILRWASRTGLQTCPLSKEESMKLASITCILLAAMPLSCGASKEIIELQRDVAQLQEQIRAMQKSLDQLTLLTQQALDVGNRSNPSLAVMDRALTETTKQMQQIISAPIITVGTQSYSLS